MPAARRQDRRWLELHRSIWRVTIAVPRHLQKAVGSTRLKASLKTDSLAVANRRKVAVIAALQQRLEAAEALHAGEADALIQEAIDIRREMKTADDRHAEVLRRVVDETLLKSDANSDWEFNPHEGDWDQIVPARQKKLLDRYVDIALGTATPLEEWLERHIVDRHIKHRTADDTRRAVRIFDDWCKLRKRPANVETLTDDDAIRFFDEIEQIAGPLHPISKRKYHGRLSLYWRYLKHRKVAKADIFADITITVPRKTNEQKERSFTRSEIVQLFEKPCPEKLRDVMMIGALTAARLDVIVDLKVGDIDLKREVFHFKPQKREAGRRYVPINIELLPIVRRRTEGKSATDDFFPEWPKPKKAGSLRERSFKVSNAFTAYRRSIGVEDVVDGNRRSRVNFHSFRRWATTQLERNGIATETIDSIAGRNRAGMSMGVYSEGPAMKAARDAIATLRIPKSSDAVDEDEDFSVTPRT